MKKKLCLLLAVLGCILCLVFGFVACDGNSGGNGSANEPGQSQGGGDQDDGNHDDDDNDDDADPTEPSAGLNYERRGGSYSVAGIGTCTDQKIVIPATYESLPVTRIKYDAFKNSSIVSIKIPDSVERISRNAFSGCRNLKRVTMGNSVKYIESSAFAACTGLERITIPDSIEVIASDAFSACMRLVVNVYDNAKYLGNENNPYVVLLSADNRSITSCTIHENTKIVLGSAFGECSGLTDITVPNSVKCIGSRAFTNCTNLESVTIGNSVTSIEYEAFLDCGKLANITLGNAVKSIAPGAFNNTAYYNEQSHWENNVLYIGNYLIEAKDDLQGVYAVKNGTKVIAADAFRDCGGMTGVTLPDTVEIIDYGAFYNCTGLTSVTIPDSVTSIGESVFSECNGLTNVTIGNSVTSIGFHLVAGCNSLTSITIPASVTHFDEMAFSGCVNLANVTFEDPNGWKVSAYDDMTGATELPSSDLSNPATAATYVKTTYVNYYWEKVGGGEIPTPPTPPEPSPSEGLEYELSEDGTYYTVSGIGTCTDQKLVIPATHEGLPVKSIGEEAFKNCSSLTSVTISSSVTHIGDLAFYGCNGLTSLTIPDSVESIRDGAFAYCNSLANVVIGDSVISIGTSAFSNCGVLTSVTFGDSVESIGVFAFRECVKLTSVTIPSSVTSIESMAFQGCSKLTSVTFEDTNGWKIFRTSEPNNTTDISSSSLSDSATAATYLRSTYTAFYWEKVGGGEIPTPPEPSPSEGLDYELSEDGTYYIVSGIGTCTDTDIVIPSTNKGLPVKGIKDDAFKNCSKLTSVTIGNSVDSIGNWAFEGCNNLTSVTIGNSVDSIGRDAFEGCYRLVEIYNKSTMTITAGSTDNGYVAYRALNVYTPQEGASKLTTDGNGFVIYNGNTLVNYVGTQTEITIPNSITSIGKYAFYYCNTLTSITIPNSVTSIGVRAFESCSKLTSITIPNSVTSIGCYAFYYCSKLTSIIFKNPTGWKSSGSADMSNAKEISSSSISDPSIMANNLTGVLAPAYWKCYAWIE